jgi:hypothetical protein
MQKTIVLQEAKSVISVSFQQPIKEIATMTTPQTPRKSKLREEDDDDDSLDLAVVHKRMMGEDDGEAGGEGQAPLGGKFREQIP